MTYKEPIDYRCTNGHDLCYGGIHAGPDCPYCEVIYTRQSSARFAADLARTTPRHDQ